MRTCNAVAILALISGQAMAEAPTRDQLRAMTEQTRGVAQASLGTFARLLTPENAPRMGLRAPSDAAKARLGAPLVDHIIGLTDLQAYDGTRDPAALLRRSEQVVYPVLVDGEPRASTIVARQGNEWRAVSFGSPVATGASEAARRAIARDAAQGGTRGAAPSETFQVRIPALNLVFIGQNGDGTLLLTPTVDAPESGLTAGRTEPAREVLLRLVPLARAQDPSLPR